MTFGKYIRKAWQNASETAKQQVNEISRDGKPLIPLSETETMQTMAGKVVQAFAAIENDFSECLIKKPVMNDRSDDHGH